ncbi:glycosyltransferase family 2 protein [Tabrizicola caldifontis]|uniref:glycosyltransferase family 2 protein n=1 Tax=Tabrizicola caldifontis TaxID=2528036 RepID=UPI0010816AF7|nr:glycosyltransferase family A protein [Rhodobacter sp. YIM 73028]
MKDTRFSGPSAPGPRVAFGVCTFRRPILDRTLQSLAAQSALQQCSCCIIVADNDDTPSARGVVERAGVGQALPVHYVHAPARNISVARNALMERAIALDADFLAMIDDDEVATPDWAAALIAEISGSAADAVLGPVRASYRPGAPAWMRKAGLHDVVPVIRPDGRILTGYTGNVILRLGSGRLRDRRFDPAYGRTGGEDDVFFHGLVRDGGTIGYAPAAVAFEDIPEGREKLGFLLRRNFRAGQTFGRINAPARAAGRAILFATSTAKVSVLLAQAGLSVLSPARRTRALMRASLHAGVCSQLLGGKILEIYRS